MSKLFKPLRPGEPPELVEIYEAHDVFSIAVAIAIATTTALGGWVAYLI